MTREMNSKTEQSVTPEQQKKLQDKVDKCKQDVQKVPAGLGSRGPLVFPINRRGLRVGFMDIFCKMLRECYHSSSLFSLEALKANRKGGIICVS